VNTTSLTLLERLRQEASPEASGSSGEQEAWARFVKLYTPLLFRWARGVSLPSEEASDLVQDVLTLLVQKLPDFTYDRQKSFRGWLRTITLNKWREKARKHSLPRANVDPANLPAKGGMEDAAAFEEAEYRHYLVRRALELMRAEFQPSTWKACWECVVRGRPAADVARELKITTNAVYLAKSRVLRRLHQELAGLLD
jgi:RNA polymerase sigma-70 factor (ECF subfamily)